VSAATTLTLVGLAAEIDCRGVKACMVCETPAANMNSSLSSVLVLPRALRGKIQKVLVKIFSLFEVLEDEKQQKNI
jgi:hypothetical protein